MKRCVLTLSLLVPAIALGIVCSPTADLSAQSVSSRSTPNNLSASRAYAGLAATGISQQTKALSALRKKLAEAKTDEDKVAVGQELRSAINDFFGADMKRRGAELEKVKQRVGQMELHLTKRVSAKNEIIELQLKSFVYEADGLGLFGGGSSSAARRTLFGRLSNRTQQDPFLARQDIYKVARARNLASAGVRARPDAKERVDQLRQKLALAETAEGKAAVGNDLKLAMNDYFEEDIKRRQLELEDIRKRIDKMETQLARRQSARQEIVDLQLQIFAKEAEGLGFFGRTSGKRTRGAGTPPRRADPFAGDSGTYPFGGNSRTAR